MYSLSLKENPQFTGARFAGAKMTFSYFILNASDWIYLVFGFFDLGNKYMMPDTWTLLHKYIPYGGPPKDIHILIPGTWKC